jgi:hypothetical protein
MANFAKYRYRGPAALAAATLLSGASGCCNCSTDTGRKFDLKDLPAPLSFSEQVARLEERMLKIPRLRGEAAINGVTIRWVDEKGTHEEHAEDGRLLLRQRFGPEARAGRDPADVRLVGMAFGHRVFEAGRNSDKWWFMMLEPLVPESTAWVGDAQRPVEFGGGGNGRLILRADVVPTLLGVSPWAIRPAPEEAVAMKVDDLNGTNVLLTFGPRNDLGNGLGARIALRREVVIDRFTGEIREVRLYDAGGVLVMRSILRDYREAQVQSAEETPSTQPAAEKGPLVPYQVTLEYPARQMVIGLVFDRVVIPLRDVVYDAPEPEEGLKVIPVD